jgi:hypothetical protein
MDHGAATGMCAIAETAKRRFRASDGSVICCGKQFDRRGRSHKMYHTKPAMTEKD